MNSEKEIIRRKTRKIYVGDVPVGGMPQFQFKA